jgi:polysaccharide pyruvyl transferase WcaK-like protein
MAKITKVLIWGHHGEKNIGDDAMLRYSLESLVTTRSDLKLTLCCGDGVDLDWIKKLGVSIVPRNRTRVLREIARHHVVIILGGTLLHSSSSIYRYDLAGLAFLALMIYSRMLGKRIGLVGLGLGPFQRKIGNTLGRWSCRLAHYISVRDQTSYEWLLQSRIGSCNFRRCADPAYGLKPIRVKQDSKRLGISALPYFAGYSKDPAADSKIIAGFCEVVEYWLSCSNDSEVVLLPFNNKTGVDCDLNILREIYQRFQSAGRIKIIPYSSNPYSMIREMALCFGVIAMRYHSVLLAHLANIPMVVVDYHGKTTSLLREIKFPPAARVPATAIDSGVMLPFVKRLLDDPQAHLAARRSEEFGDLLLQLWPDDGFWNTTVDRHGVKARLQ